MKRKLGCVNIQNVNMQDISTNDPINGVNCFLEILFKTKNIPNIPIMKFENTYVFEIISGDRLRLYRADMKGNWNTIPPYIIDDVPFILSNTILGSKYGDALSNPMIIILGWMLIAMRDSTMTNSVISPQFFLKICIIEKY